MERTTVDTRRQFRFRTTGLVQCALRGQRNDSVQPFANPLEPSECEFSEFDWTRLPTAKQHC